MTGTSRQRVVRVGLGVLAVAGLWLAPPVRVLPLESAREQASVKEFEVESFVRRFWTEQLLPATRGAADAGEVLAALAADPAAASERFGRRLGLSQTANYFVAGRGRIVTIGPTGFIVALDGPEAGTILLHRGPVFGNAVRDGCGLLDVSDFANSQDFNAVSTLINRRIEEEVLPRLESGAKVGAPVVFVGFAEVSQAPTEDRPLRIVPIRVEFPDESAAAVVLEAKEVSKAFPGVKALDRVSLRLRSGRLTAILGENGAGKSTLMNVLSGVYPPDAGSVELEGREVRFRNPSEARDAGIAMIFQELNLAANLTVAENIFLGREPLDRWGLVDTRRMEREARFWLARMDAELPPDALVGELRVGRQQVVEIARALSADARVLILDEPTSALGEHEVEVLFRVLADLKRQGVAMAYITHKFEELARIADDLVVMRDGRVVGSATYGQMSRDQLVRLMVGREAVAAGRVDRVPVTDASEVLAVEGLSLRHPERPGDFLLREISFTLRRGEILGVFGLMGAGRTELLETLFGVHPHGTSGTVRLHGSPVRLGSPAEAIRRGLALAPEDRKGSGLVLDSSVAVNHTLACLDRFERWGLLDEGAERESAKQAVDRFRIRTPSVDQPVRLLSGGNQQKVILGKWLTTSPEVLLLDEPTRGIDVNAKQEIYELIRDLAGQGLAVIMASSELPEVLAFTHRILVLCEGRLTGVLEAAEATEADILEAALPA